MSAKKPNLLEELNTVYGFSESYVESFKEGLAIFNADGEILIVNKAICNMTGFDKDEIVGLKSSFPFWPSNEHVEYNTRFKKIIKNNLNGEFESKHVRKNGDCFPVNIFFASIKSVKNEVVAHLAVIQDVSGIENNTPVINVNKELFSVLNYRKKYLDLIVKKNVASAFENSLNNIPDGFISLDTNWYYTYVNKQAAEFLGKLPEDLIGKHIWTEFPEGVGLPFYNAYYKAVDTQEVQYFEDYYAPFNRWYENRVYPSADGLTVYFTDVTEKKKAEKKNQMLLSLIETSDDFIGLATFEGEPIYLNVNGRKLVGLEKEEKMPTSISDFFPKNYQDKIEKEHMPNIYKNNKWNGEVELVNFKSGNVIPIEMSGFLIKDNKTNKPIALGVVASDISKSKESERKLIKSEEKFSKVFKSHIIGFSIVNKDQIRIDVNDTMAKILETTKEHLIGKTFEEAKVEVLDEAYYKQKQTFSEKIFKEGFLNNEPARRVLNSGKVIDLLVSVEPLEIAGEVHALFSVIDNTSKKRAELELVKHRNNLEELVELRTIELEKEKVKAQSADLMKSAFLATMSHELRTPMNSIIGFTGILLKELAGPLNVEQTKQLSMVKNSSAHLLSLINDVLDISKIEAGKLRVSFYPFDYLTSLEKTIDFLEPQASRKGLEISTEISNFDITLISDERRIEQVLLNLLSNAIKFSEKGKIIVKVRVKGSMVITQIIDQGIGITKQDAIKLFMPFIQLEGGLNRKHEGTGLGLAICKSLIEKLGGTIQVESDLGKGSNFTFKLPLEYSYK